MPSPGAHTQGIVLVGCLLLMAEARAYNVSIKLYNKTPNSHHLVQQTFYELAAEEPTDDYQQPPRDLPFFRQRQRLQQTHRDGGSAVQQTRFQSYDNTHKTPRPEEDTPFDYYEVHRDAGRVVSNVVQNIEDYPGAQQGYKTTDGLSAHASLRGFKCFY